MKTEVYKIDESRRDDFFKIHCAATGHGWCFCVAWWVPTWEKWSERNPMQNRQLREKLFDRGEYDGYLLYVNDYPAGWCQCGQRDRLTKLVKSYKLEPDPSVWAMTCFVISPKYRDIGLCHYFVAEIIKDSKKRGVKKIQGFPRRGENLPFGDVWTGPEAIFIRAGFALEKDDTQYPVYGLKF